MKINLNNAKILISAGNPSQFPNMNVPQVALSGRSNVGKSSLINCLLQRNGFARVSSTPGKTVTVNYYNIDSKLMLVDLPGYGFAKSSFEDKKRWSALTDAYFTRGNDMLRGVVQLVDANVGATRDDLDMITYLQESGIPFIVVYTKTDKMKATDKNKLSESLPQFESSSLEILFSSKSKEGRDKVLNAIYSLIEE